MQLAPEVEQYHLLRHSVSAAIDEDFVRGDPCRVLDVRGRLGVNNFDVAVIKLVEFSYFYRSTILLRDAPFGWLRGFVRSLTMIELLAYHHLFRMIWAHPFSG